MAIGLGVGIGGGVILISIVVAICYCCKKKTQVTQVELIQKSNSRQVNKAVLNKVAPDNTTIQTDEEYVGNVKVNGLKNSERIDTNSEMLKKDDVTNAILIE